MGAMGTGKTAAQSEHRSSETDRSDKHSFLKDRYSEYAGICLKSGAVIIIQKKVCCPLDNGE